MLALVTSALALRVPPSGSRRAILAGGSLPNLATEATVRMHSSTLHVELLGDTWRADLAPKV